MSTQSFVQKKVKKFYWEHDFNCATASLLVLSDRLDIKLSGQVLDAAVGMHGAGGYRAQCGLVEGTLMFLGIIGRQARIPDKEIEKACKRFASKFERRFSSLLCSVLRPGGFSADDPPHLCEGLSCRAICFSIEFVDEFINR